MPKENQNWILVEGSSPEAIQSAVIDHSHITIPVQPSRHCTFIYKLDTVRFAVTFTPKVPPYDFTNLVSWLNDPQMNRGVRRAVGWLNAPGNGIRFFLAPDRANARGDTVLGVGANGNRVTVMLQDCTVRPCTHEILPVPEPEFPVAGIEPVASFEITLDGDTSFGNPQFEV